VSKSKKRSSAVSKTERQAKQWPKAAIVASVVLLIGAVLVLKGATDGAADQIGNTATATATATIAAVGAKQATTLPGSEASPGPATAVASDLPEEQLQQALAAGKPTFAFFHSNNCKQCINMMKVVDEVYPEFKDSVVLVDVNVYDKQNAKLLQVANIRGIPTQIFFDKAGQGQVVMGAMTTDSFRKQMQTLAGGQ